MIIRGFTLLDFSPSQLSNSIYCAILIYLDSVASYWHSRSHPGSRRLDPAHPLSVKPVHARSHSSFCVFVELTSSLSRIMEFGRWLISMNTSGYPLKPLRTKQIHTITTVTNKNKRSENASQVYLSRAFASQSPVVVAKKTLLKSGFSQRPENLTYEAVALSSV